MMAAPDSTMDLFPPRSELSVEADAQVLSDYLYLKMEWRKRREIMPDLDWTDDRIRHAAEAAQGDIIFGQRGIKHIRHGTPEEVRKCIAAMKSQVEATQIRILNTEKKYHSYGGSL